MGFCVAPLPFEPSFQTKLRENSSSFADIVGFAFIILDLSSTNSNFVCDSCKTTQLCAMRGVIDDSIVFHTYLQRKTQKWMIFTRSLLFEIIFGFNHALQC